MKNVVASLSSVKAFMGNRVLDREWTSEFTTGTTGTDIAEGIIANGYDFMTADIFLSKKSSEKAFLIADTGLGYFLLDRNKFIPSIFMSLESPVVAWPEYHHLRLLANRFHHLFLWPGTEDRVGNNRRKFHPIYWPNTRRSVVPGLAWGDRKFLAMINANKRTFQYNWSNISAASPVKSLALIGLHAYGQIVKRTDLWMRSELYVERLKTIEFFSSNPGFDLFGQGWENPVPGFERQLRPCIVKCGRGPIPGGDEPKLNVLSQYKFSLCFENTSFPGYITEKIFDCFFAGTIPVYLGAPDISDYVPAETFVDYRQFKSHDELNDFLNSMSEQEAQSYLDAAKEFMTSPLFDKFQSNSLIKAMVAALNSVRDQHS